jgi:hypothetical protein
MATAKDHRGKTAVGGAGGGRGTTPASGPGYENATFNVVGNESPWGYTELAEMAGIPPEFSGEITIVPVSGGIGGPSTLVVADGQGLTIETTMRSDGVAEIARFQTDPGGTYAGRGAGLLSQQAAALRGRGFVEMTVTTEGQGNGSLRPPAPGEVKSYYNFARAGFVPNAAQAAQFTTRYNQATGSDAKSFRQLMNTAQGRQWFYRFGSGYSGTFDLRPSSYSSMTLKKAVKGE